MIDSSVAETDSAIANIMFCGYVVCETTSDNEKDAMVYAKSEMACLRFMLVVL